MRILRRLLRRNISRTRFETFLCIQKLFCYWTPIEGALLEIKGKLSFFLFFFQISFDSSIWRLGWTRLLFHFIKIWRINALFPNLLHLLSKFCDLRGLFFFLLLGFFLLINFENYCRLRRTHRSGIPTWRKLWHKLIYKTTRYLRQILIRVLRWSKLRRWLDKSHWVIELNLSLWDFTNWFKLCCL